MFAFMTKILSIYINSVFIFKIKMLYAHGCLKLYNLMSNKPFIAGRAFIIKKIHHKSDNEFRKTDFNFITVKCRNQSFLLVFKAPSIKPLNQC